MIRVLQFADVINRHDFIDTIVQRANPNKFVIGTCVRSDKSNIASPVYHERTPRWILGAEHRWEIGQAVWRMATILRQWKADILHAHHYDQGVIAWLATKLYPRTRLVIGRHYSDAIYRSSSGWKQRALLFIERLVNQAAARIIVPSSYCCEILTDRQKVNAWKAVKIPYGFVAEKYALVTPLDTARFRHELGLGDHFVLGNFARLAEEKGQRFLIQAMAELKVRFPTLKLLIVGEGPERSALEEQIKTLNLGQTVQLLGWRRDALNIMAAVDCVVQPTLQEAFSQVMAEAMWMLKPLVMTDVSGAPDIITDGENGLLVPKGDVKALVRAIERLSRDGDFRSRLGTAGRDYVARNLSVEKIIPSFENVYAEVMEE